MAYFTAAELKTFDPDLASFSDAQCDAERDRTQLEFERICGVAFEARTVTSEWHLGDGAGWLWLDWHQVTSVTAASIDGVALSAGELADLVVDRRMGRLWRQNGWTNGEDILVTYAHGYTAVPADIKQAAMLRTRERLARTMSGIHDRSERFTVRDGVTIGLARASANLTGIDDVDAVLQRRSERFGFA